MKNFRFYLEFPTASAKRRSGKGNEGHSGNCIAVLLDDNGRPSWIPGGDCLETFSAVYYQEDSPVCGSQASAGYLQSQCKRVSEGTARQVHPRLFAYLEQ